MPVSESDSPPPHQLLHPYRVTMPHLPPRGPRERLHEKPWADAYRTNLRVISLESLIDYFGPLVDDEYARRIYEQKLAV